MKSLFVIVFLCLLFAANSQAQRIYSKQNLQKASTTDLGLYLAKAEKLKKKGWTLSIAGTLAAFGGMVVFDNSWGSSNATITDIAGLVFVAGFAATVVGVPMFFSGMIRIDKIRKIMKMNSNTVFIELNPCRLYEINAQGNQAAGLTLRMRF